MSMESATLTLTSHYDLSKTGLTDAMAAATHNETAPTRRGQSASHQSKKGTSIMKLKIEITGEQEDAVVAQSLQQSYDRTYGADHGMNAKEIRELQKALRVVFHYYTGESIE